MAGGPIPPSVSIVMPTLNQAPFIAESVRSVMSQRIEGLELVVVDGGSGDGTQEALATLSAEFPGRLRWSSWPDGGPAQAVNAAVARSRGAIVGWLNSDDLYAPGAVQRALDHLARQPDQVMVYGNAEHVDEHGATIAAYPSRPPQTALSEWADGCHICQPSAFFRREAFDALGGLDTGLRAAFDFDLWLRLFKAYPGRVGFISDLQARSRLHAAAITMRFRERVALEGLQVVHRHLGVAPVHWLLTHFAEIVAQHPFQTPVANLAEHMRDLAATAERWVGRDGLAALHAHIDQNRAVQCAAAGFAMSAHADGWAAEVLDLRLRQSAPAVGRLRVHGRHVSPYGGTLALAITAPDGDVAGVDIVRPGRFEFDVDVAERRPEARLLYRVRASACFVPAEVDAGSNDLRRLAFLVDHVELLPG
jgi:hypothetical protein